METKGFSAGVSSAFLWGEGGAVVGLFHLDVWLTGRTCMRWVVSGLLLLLLLWWARRAREMGL